MEPFSALSNMLRNPTYTDRYSALSGLIGGAPQLLKVYPFFRTVEFGDPLAIESRWKALPERAPAVDYEKVMICPSDR